MLRKPMTLLALAASLIPPAQARAQERLPQQVAGAWRITRILPVHANSCWTEKEAQPLVGSILEYGQSQMRWLGGIVPLTGVTTRAVTSDVLERETAAGSGPSLKLADLGIRSAGVTEVNMQHEDADITRSTTEVPGDSVLIAGTGRIIVSACGIYMEARRLAPRATGDASRKGL